MDSYEKYDLRCVVSAIRENDAYTKDEHVYQGHVKGYTNTHPDRVAWLDEHGFRGQDHSASSPFCSVCGIKNEHSPL